MHCPRLLTCVLVTLLLCPVITSASESDTATSVPAAPFNEFINIAPHDLHVYMAEQKAKTLERLQRAAPVSATRLPGQENMDALYYKLELSIDLSAQEMSGQLTMRARSLVDGFLEPVLDFITWSMDIDSVLVNGVWSTGWWTSGETMTIPLGIVHDTGDDFEITVAYHGYPADGFWYSNHATGRECSTLSEPYGARGWWPCVNNNADKPDSMDIIVEVDSQYFVSSNGVLRETIDNGGTTVYHWHEAYPIAPYLVSLAISNYSHFRSWYTYGPADADSMPVDFYPYPEVYTSALQSWPETVQMIGFFADAFGEYPFVDEKYGMTNFFWSGAMEHQTNTSATSSAFGFDRFLIAHELAHQWWGDYITCKSWQHIWLNEGFASYCEALYAEHLWGAAVYRSYMNSMQFWNDGTIYVYDTTNANEILHTRVYDKGAWVLHMLRGIVGDNVFFAMLHAYYDTPKFAYGGATTEGFRDVCEAVSGRELDAFFAQWIYDEYYPIYLSGYIQDPVTNQARVYILQLQSDEGWRPCFEMPIQLKFLYAGGGDTVVAVDNTLADQTYVIDLPAPVDSMAFDPDNWILKYAVQQNRPLFWRETLEINDALGDNNHRADPGEQDVEMTMTMYNLGVDALDLSVHLTTPYPEIVFANDEVDYGDVLHGQFVDNLSEPFVFSVDADFPPTIVDFILQYSSYGGMYVFSDTIRMDVGRPQVIIIDDDLSNPLEYEEYFTHFLDSACTPHVVWGKDTLASPPIDTLMAYPLTVWFTGNARAEVLSAADVAALAELLDAGGRLLLTGQDIAQDLANDADSTFLRDYLHVRFVPGMPMLLADGVPGDPISDGHCLPLGGPGGAANQNSPDILQALDGSAKSIYTYYQSADIAGVRITSDDYRAVFLGFGAEAIADGLPGFTKRDVVLAAIWEWLSRPVVAYVPGDLNGDEEIGPLDVTWMVDYVYRAKALQFVRNAADINSDCTINPVDVVYLVNFVFKTLGELQPGCVE